MRNKPQSIKKSLLKIENAQKKGCRANTSQTQSVLGKLKIKQVSGATEESEPKTTNHETRILLATF